MTNIRRKGTFGAQAAERSGRASQATPLPPRCHSCRLPGIHTTYVSGIAEFYCTDHIRDADLSAWDEGKDK